jgi:hypothetical protein
MAGKRVLAVIFALLILVKVAFLLINPGKWLGIAQVLTGYTGEVTIAYLIALAIIGYFIFTSIDIIDVAVVMLFTGLLVGLNLIPYAASLHTTMQEIATTGLGKAWLALIIWVAIAIAVLMRVFAKAR